MTPKYSGVTKFMLVLMTPSPFCPGKTAAFPNPIPRIKARFAMAAASTPGKARAPSTSRRWKDQFRWLS